MLLDMSLNLIVEAIERFKQLVVQHYKEPVNRQFEDCTKEVLHSDEENQNIITERLKMIVMNMCNGNKVAVLIIESLNFCAMLFSRHLIFAPLTFCDFF